MAPLPRLDEIPRRARGRKTRDEVLGVAARAVREGGVANVRVGKIMHGAGKTHGGFYGLFASKDDLANAAVEHLLDLPLRLFERCAAGKGPAAGVIAYVDFYLSPAHRDEVLSGCPIPGLVSDLPRLPVVTREHADRSLADLTAAISARLAEAGVTPRAPVESAVWEMIGALAVARAVTEPDRVAAMLDAARGSVLDKLGIEPGEASA